MCLIIIIKLENYSIIMNDVSSLLMATSILAIGGLGLYMYKNPDDDNEDDTIYNDDSVFSGNLFGPEQEQEEEYNEHVEDEEYYEPKARTKGGKTKRNRKTTGTKRRR